MVPGQPQRRGYRARKIEDVGVAALAVHGRTRECRFFGAAEHDTVARIKARASIPVFANGDIGSLSEACQVLRQTGCDGVMIGRAALGQPWLLGDIAAGKERRRGVLERFGILEQHVRALHEFYGDPGIRIARKHVRWYLQRLEQPSAAHVESAAGASWVSLGRQFNQLEEADAQLDYLRGCAMRMAA